MKYPLTASAGGVAWRLPRPSVSALASTAWHALLRHWGVLAALALTFAVHAPTLHYFFAGDDFVVLGSIEYEGPRDYLTKTFLMHDIVPNWRPLTAAVYTAEWELFGLNATAWRAFNLSVHMTSMLLLYAVTLRTTKRPMVGAVAAVIFGVSGAHFDTVTYITALPHVLATCFVLASLLALVSYTQDGERSPAAFVLSFLLFTLAFLANEGAFVFAPMLAAAYALFATRWRRAAWPRGLVRLALHVAPFAALATGWLLFYELGDWEQLKFEGYAWGPHVFRNYAVYLSWIGFPSESVPLDPDAMRWWIAGVVAASVLAMALRGPHLARVGAIGIALALLPFAPVEIWTASRYTYAAVAFFAPVAAIAAYAVYDRVRSAHALLRVPATLVALAFVVTVAGLYAWQTSAQNAHSGKDNERWALLVDELRRNHEQVPPGTTIYIVNGPWTNPMEQYTWVPSVARALYGDAAAFNLSQAEYASAPPPIDGALFLYSNEGRLEPLWPLQARAANP